MEEARKSYQVKSQLLKKTERERNLAIESIGKVLKKKLAFVLIENAKDMKAASEKGLTKAFMDRLKLDETRINSLIHGLNNIASQEQVVGVCSDFFTRKDGLKIEKMTIPIGVIGMIFESRPNIVIDSSALAIKSGNAIILKGGSDALYTNKAFAEIVREGIAPYMPKDSVQLIQTREQVSHMLSQVGLIDLIIPRGGESLIRYVYENSKIPVIAHFKGLCHLFLDRDFNEKKALEIILNSKAQRTGVCNALETLLIHQDISENFLKRLFKELKDREIEVRTCGKTKRQGDKMAHSQDWETEYLDRILSVKTVNGIEEAILHIEKYGSQHTEGIISNNQKNIERFLKEVDASAVMVNASTRFNDGGEFGMGAEMGISTTKLHAYGPMGAKELTSSKSIIRGDGHIRG